MRLTKKVTTLDSFSSSACQGLIKKSVGYPCIRGERGGREIVTDYPCLASCCCDAEGGAIVVN